MIQVNNFKGLTGTIAVNEFVANVIELVKNMSPTWKEQKAEERNVQLECLLLNNQPGLPNKKYRTRLQ